MELTHALTALLIFPCGIFLLANALAYEWYGRKLIARMQGRVGPRWYQPFADVVKLWIKENLLPDGAQPLVFALVPALALAGVLTAALYVPMLGLDPIYSFAGDLIVTIYMLSLLTLSIGLAGANAASGFSLVGAMRALSQLFAYEAPFLLALLGPALVAGSWEIRSIIASHEGQWLMFAQPIGFVVAVLSIIGKLELHPFDAPEAETEIVGGALTEYSGRGFALFNLAKRASLVVSLTLVSALYLGGLHNPLDYLVKTLALYTVMIAAQALITRLRIDQTVLLWWRVGALLALAQWALIILGGL